MSSNLDFQIISKMSFPAIVPDHPEIIAPNSAYISVCLKCFNTECAPVLQALKDEYYYDLEDNNVELDDILCLISLKLNVFTNFDHLKEMENNQYKVPFKLYLQEFYNNITKYGKGISYLHPKLKGGAYAMLCMILKKALEMNTITPDDFIVLTASGDLDEREDMSGLVRYYERIGFKQVEPQNEYQNIQDMEVPMYGRVKDVLQNCKKMTISDELKQIVESI